MDKNSDDHISFDEFIEWFKKFVQEKFGVAVKKE